MNADHEERMVATEADSYRELANSRSSFMRDVARVLSRMDAIGFSRAWDSENAAENADAVNSQGTSTPNASKRRGQGKEH